MATTKASSNTSLLQQLQALRASDSLNTSASDTNAHILHSIGILGGLSISQLTQGENTASDPLALLDPALDTLPYLFILNSQLDKSFGKSKGLNDNLRLGGRLYQKLATFLTHFNPVEVRYAGAAWRQIVDTLASIILEEQDADLTAPVILMAGAILRLDPTAGTFTSSHLKYIQICLETRMYAQACLILDNDIHSLPPNNALYPVGIFSCSSHSLSDAYITVQSGLTGKLNLNDVIEYYLSGAMVYIGLKRWTSAIFCLEHVLSVPSSNAASGYMLEAYKKWTLTNLLANGRPCSLPKIAGGASLKTLRALAKPYDIVADAFTRNNSRKLRTEVEEAQDVFREDGNYGLVLQVVNHHQKLSVSSLGKVYAAIPLASLTLDVPPDQGEAYVNSLINAGILNGRLEQSTENGGPVVLRFSQDNMAGPQAKSETQLRQELIVQANRMKGLAQHVAGVDQRISLSKEYLELVRKARKTKEDRAHEEDAMDVTYVDAPMSGQLSDEEESVMADAG